MKHTNIRIALDHCAFDRVARLIASKWFDAMEASYGKPIAIESYCSGYHIHVRWQRVKLSVDLDGNVEIGHPRKPPTIVLRPTETA